MPGTGGSRSGSRSPIWAGVRPPGPPTGSSSWAGTRASSIPPPWSGGSRCQEGRERASTPAPHSGRPWSSSRENAARCCACLARGRDALEARSLVERYRAVSCDAVLSEVQAHWNQVLGTVQVETPDPSSHEPSRGPSALQGGAVRPGRRRVFRAASRGPGRAARSTGSASRIRRESAGASPASTSTEPCSREARWFPCPTGQEHRVQVWLG